MPDRQHGGSLGRTRITSDCVETASASLQELLTGHASDRSVRCVDADDAIGAGNSGAARRVDLRTAKNRKKP
jgi:hypothetical protein